ncbi:MAG: ferric reductase-like transmembrane domain-containing protein [Candidatus Woesebacteria bacterium]
MFQKLLQFVAPNRSNIIHLFQLFYVGCVLFLGFAYWQIAADDGAFLGPVIRFGLLCGELAIYLFIVVTLPGILGRFGVKHPLITIGIMFRRHLGISTFLLALMHASIVYFFPQLAIRGDLFSFSTFQLFGFLTLLSFTLLASTSNDFSVKTLGKNWKRLHKLVYVIFWLIFLHVGLQRNTKYMVLIGAAGVLEVVSLLYDAWKRRQPLPPAPPVVTPIPKETV